MRSKFRMAKFSNLCTNEWCFLRIYIDEKLVFSVYCLPPDWQKLNGFHWMVSRQFRTLFRVRGVDFHIVRPPVVKIKIPPHLRISLCIYEHRAPDKVFQKFHWFFLPDVTWKSHWCKHTRTETPFNPIDGHRNFFRWTIDGVWIIAQRMGAVVEHFWVIYI